LFILLGHFDIRNRNQRPRLIRVMSFRLVSTK
jgi:hypothetical protein